MSWVGAVTCRATLVVELAPAGLKSDPQGLLPLTENQSYIDSVLSKLPDAEQTDFLTNDACNFFSDISFRREEFSERSKTRFSGFGFKKIN